MRLSEHETAIITGTLLGDGCLERNGKFVRLRMEHSMTQKAYVLWKFAKLQRIVTGRPMKVHAHHKKSGMYYDSLRIYSRTNVLLEPFWEYFYGTSGKQVPLNISSLLRHPLAVAVWLMDDGYKRNDCNAFRFNTDAFAYEDQLRLCAALQTNFGIACSMHRKGKYWNIYVPQRSFGRLVDMTKRYVIPSLQYKIALAP